MMQILLSDFVSLADRYIRTAHGDGTEYLILADDLSGLSADLSRQETPDMPLGPVIDLTHPDALYYLRAHQNMSADFHRVTGHPKAQAYYPTVTYQFRDSAVILKGRDISSSVKGQFMAYKIAAIAAKKHGRKPT